MGFLHATCILSVISIGLTGGAGKVKQPERQYKLVGTTTFRNLTLRQSCIHLGGMAANEVATGNPCGRGKRNGRE